MQVKVLKDVNLRVGDHSVPCKVGEVREMPDADAKMHAAAGYVEIMNGKPVQVEAVKIANKPQGVGSKSFKKE